MKNNEKGQLIIGAIIVLLILAILIPGLILYTQNDTKWTVKEQRTTRAFQLAEAAVERGYSKVIQSTTVWNSLMAGTQITGYHFDQVYTDIQGGTYEIRISTGPGAQTISITGVAKDSTNNEIRAVKTTYGNSASNAAIYCQGGITLTDNPGVEWGPVMSPAQMDTSQAHPRFYSAANILQKDTNFATPPNSDNVQWWSYYANLPPAPQVDLNSYLSSATTSGTYFPAASYSISNGDQVGTYYYAGNLTYQPHNFLTGNLIVMGNFTLQGNAANGAYTATLPTNAWKEYGNDWAYYRSNYDGSAPATFPGINGSYAHGTITKAINKVVVHGFMYVGGSFSITGGGNCCVHGSMYVGQPSDLTGSGVKIYYDDSTTIWTKNVTLGRQSWQEIVGCGWSGTNATCPG